MEAKSAKDKLEVAKTNLNATQKALYDNEKKLCLLLESQQFLKKELAEGKEDVNVVTS